MNPFLSLVLQVAIWGAGTLAFALWLKRREENKHREELKRATGERR